MGLDTKKSPITYNTKQEKKLMKESQHLNYFRVNFQFNPKSLQDFLQAIQEAGDMEDIVYILAFIYTHRAVFRLNYPRPDVILKMYLVSIFLAHKFLIEDEEWPLEEFAKLISCKVHHLMKMELWLASDLLNFKLAITNEKLSRTKIFLAQSKVKLF